MEITLHFEDSPNGKADLILISAFQKKVRSGVEASVDINHWPEDYQETFLKIKAATNYKGDKNDSFTFHLKSGQTVLVWGLGQKLQLDHENIRKLFANAFKAIKGNIFKNVSVDLDSFDAFDDIILTTKLLVETVYLTQYSFDKYLSDKPKGGIAKFIFVTSEKALKGKVQKAFSFAQTIAAGVNFTRDLVNEPPNFLNSEQMADIIENDVKSNLQNVKVKILNKALIRKERMNLLLAVNQGSAFEPRVVHLNYRPKKVTSKTKHVALVGKGLTFDSGGYSLKPSSSMMGMKFDMAGAATVYAAFRNAVQFSPNKVISCFLGITDNMVSSHAITPDTIVKSRAGLQIEILNTDAEGRLVLADVLDYACDFHPDIIIDAATLTGACIRALGAVCGVMGNNKPLTDTFLKKAEDQGEYAWYLPIFEEYREDMKSKIGDLKNVGASGNAGAQKAAVFLEKFIRKEVHWLHLDIAGISDSATHLPYCPPTGASGLMVRTLTQFLIDE